MIDDKRLPTPEQVCAWLGAHGWAAESPLPVDPEDGVDFTYKERSDAGRDIWVRAPRVVLPFPYYQLGVRAVITTAAWIEGRTEDDVYAEMLATEVPSAPQAPASVA